MQGAERNSKPVTDVNLVWRGVFLFYTFIGTEIEERKLVVALMNLPLN